MFFIDIPGIRVQYAKVERFQNLLENHTRCNETNGLNATVKTRCITKYMVIPIRMLNNLRAMTY